VRRRDAALRRLRRAKHVMATGSLVLGGVVAAAAARTFPGHAIVTRPAQSTVHRTARPLHRSPRPVNHHRERAAHPSSAITSSTAKGPMATTPSTATTSSARLTPPASTPTPTPVSSATVTSGGS
jgi:hypothetical protein